MSLPKIAKSSSKSVICLDSTIELTTDDDESFSVSDFVSPEKSSRRGVAPEGFIILDESNGESNDESNDEFNDECNNEIIDSSIDKTINESNNESIDESHRSIDKFIDVPKSDKDEKITRDEDKKMDKPMFKVMFRDEAVARQYKKRVREFLHRLIIAEDRDDDANSSELVLEVWKRRSGRKRSCDHLDSRSKIEAKNVSPERDNALFTIDKKPLMQDRLDVPTYGKKFDCMTETSSVAAEPKEEQKPTRAAARPSMNCWNCLGNHSIRDCQKPRNQMEIAKNRTEFQSRAPRGGRYHVDNDQSKYGHFVPGQISNELKKALGLRDNDLPRHIYRMRILGYPPGWLKEAQLQHSGMNLYDSDGERELDPLEEPGQIPEIGDKDQFDVNKLHDFPGFNVRAPAGTREKETNYWESERYTRHSKESMLAMMSERKVDGYQRKKLKRTVETDSPHAAHQPTVTCDMDVVEDSEDGIIEDGLSNGEFVPPLPKSPANPPLPNEPEEPSTDSPTPEHLDFECLASPNNTDSPSLADLERRKKQLLDELENSNSPSSNPSTPLSGKYCNTGLPITTIEETEPSASSLSNDDDKSQFEDPDNTVTPTQGAVKSVCLGTPILESTSPWNKLPSVEKFSKDICDIINFENLPDSTGKYEQMSGLLNKVRNTLANIQHE